MKKLILLSVLLLVLAVSVSAAYNTMPVSVIKTTMPAVAPVSVRTAVPPTVQEDCPTMCKRLISQGMGVFIRCMHDRCKEDCESSCREMYGSQSQDYIAKFCMPQLAPKETCEQGCDKKLDECLKTTVGINIESIRAACAKLHNECMQEKCGKPEQPPETCEQGCDRKRDECLKTAVGLNIEGIRAACEKLHGECMREKCKPEQPCPPQDTCLKDCVDKCYPQRGCPPQTGKCEDKCVDNYHGCIKSGRDANECRNMLGDCVDKCGGRMPPSGCQEKCIRDKFQCLKETNNEEMCVRKTKKCIDECAPAAPPETCLDRCATIKDDCTANNLDESSCEKKIRDCFRQCQPQPEQVQRGQVGMARTPEVSDGGPAPPARKLSPEEMKGLNPQPEPPSIFRRFLGWLGGD